MQITNLLFCTRLLLYEIPACLPICKLGHISTLWNTQLRDISFGLQVFCVGYRVFYWYCGFSRGLLKGVFCYGRRFFLRRWARVFFDCQRGFFVFTVEIDVFCNCNRCFLRRPAGVVSQATLRSSTSNCSSSSY